MKIVDKIKSIIHNFTYRELVEGGSSQEKVDDVLLEAIRKGESITREDALTIPAVSSAVGLISDSFAMIPFKLYKKENMDNRKQTHEVDDYRVSIINKDTGDTLDGFQFKKALCEDYLMGKGGYAYIERKGNTFKSLRYVEDKKVTINKNTNSIFKNYDITVDAKNYKPFYFLKLLRNTKDGASGKGYTVEINESLQTAYKRIMYELDLMKTNGNKKGFLKL